MVVVAPKALRQAGTVGVTRPASNAVAGSTYKFTALMDAGDIADPTLTLQFRLSLDQLQVREDSWTCGVKDRAGNSIAPFFTYSTPILPTNYRVETDLPRALNLGLDVTIA